MDDNNHFRQYNLGLLKLAGIIGAATVALGLLYGMKNDFTEQVRLRAPQSAYTVNPNGDDKDDFVVVDKGGKKTVFIQQSDRTFTLLEELRAEQYRSIDAAIQKIQAEAEKAPAQNK